MYISKYSDADIYRYLDDQMRFFHHREKRTAVYIHLCFKPFLLTLDLGSINIEPSLYTKPISQYKALFARFEDTDGYRIIPADEPGLKHFAWVKASDYGKYIGRQFLLAELCEMIRDLDKISRLGLFL